MSLAIRQESMPLASLEMYEDIFIGFSQALLTRINTLILRIFPSYAKQTIIRYYKKSPPKHLSHSRSPSKHI